MRKESDSNRRNYNTSETQSDRYVLHTGDPLVKLTLLFQRGYKVFRQDRENQPKGGLLTLVRNNIPAEEIQRSGQADLDTEYLVVRLVLTGTPVTVFNIYSPPDKQIQLHNIKVEPQSWIITGDFNSHSPSWGYKKLNSKGEKVENWITENRLILINKPDDPDTFYS